MLGFEGKTVEIVKKLSKRLNAKNENFCICGLMLIKLTNITQIMRKKFNSFILQTYIAIFMLFGKQNSHLMSKIIFEINYNINPAKRNEYLELAEKLKDVIKNNLGKDYDIYENKKGSNNFSEIYVCKDEEEYENIEDNNDESVMDLTDKLYSITDGKVSYITKYGI